MMWFLWSCFWAVEILFDGGSQGYVTYDPPWHFTNISPGKALAFSVMEKKKNHGSNGKPIHIFQGGMWEVELKAPVLPRCLLFVFQCIFWALHYTTVHHPSGLQQSFQPSRSPTCTNVIPCGSPRLNHTAKKNGSHLPTLLQAAQSTMAQLKGSWEQAREQRAVEPKPR